MEQNFDNHRRFVPLYHFVLAALLVLTLIGAGVNFFKALGNGAGLYSASLLLVLSIGVILNYYFLRAFALRAQDRLIRLEENFRNYLRNGKLLDPRLTMRQIIGLRFASDEEYDELAKKAAESNMSEQDIKKAVKNWRGDPYRV